MRSPRYSPRLEQYPLFSRVCTNSCVRGSLVRCKSAQECGEFIFHVFRQLAVLGIERQRIADVGFTRGKLLHVHHGVDLHTPFVQEWNAVPIRGACAHRVPRPDPYIRQGWRWLRPPNEPNPFAFQGAVLEVHAPKIPHNFTGPVAQVTVFQHQQAVGQAL